MSALEQEGRNQQQSVCAEPWDRTMLRERRVHYCPRNSRGLEQVETPLLQQQKKKIGWAVREVPGQVAN